jgi:ABC-type oligopeptide transport system ATPase subunit
VQAVFQDPASSLNPRRRVWDLVTHPLWTHRVARGRRERRAAAVELLEMVELRAADAERLPHEMSLGQRQRIAIARALALRPALIVADEPVSALDVSVQAQILVLLERLQGELGLSYVFISHDLRVVRHLCRRLYVMNAGEVVEEGFVEEVFAAPAHPYTRKLLASVPRLAVSLAGEPGA